MKTYTSEIRLSAIKAFIEKMLDVDKITELFGCSVPTLYRWVSEYKKEQKYKSNTSPGRPRKLSLEDEKRIIAQVEKTSDITLNELVDLLKLDVSRYTVANILTKHGFTYKKNSESQGTRKRRCSGKKTKLE